MLAAAIAPSESKINTFGVVNDVHTHRCLANKLFDICIRSGQNFHIVNQSIIVFKIIYNKQKLFKSDSKIDRMYKFMRSKT